MGVNVLPELAHKRPLTVAFFMVPTAGHLYPSFSLAKCFRSLGANVIYLVGDAGAALVAREKLPFVLDRRMEIFHPSKKQSRQPWWTFFSGMSKRMRLLDAFVRDGRQLLSGIKADILFVDSVLGFAPLAAVGTGTQVYTLSVLNFPVFGEPYPPPGSSLVPRFGIGYRAVMHLSWLKFLAQGMGLLSDHSSVRPNFALVWMIYRKLSHATKRTGRRVRWSQFGPLLDYPRIILGPAELDFFPNPRTRYLGFCIDTSRVQGSTRWVAREGRRTVVCSFGGQTARYDRANAVYDAIVKAFVCRPDLDLLLHVPAAYRAACTPDNITFVESIPVLNVLREVNAAIVHGGYGLVKECVLRGVPMIVIPFLFDQRGTAARVQHLQIGVKCDAAGLNSPILHQALDTVLRPEMRERVTKLSQQISAQDHVQAFVQETLVAFATRPETDAQAAKPLKDGLICRE